MSRSGYNDWTTRGPSDRELSDRRLAEEIKAIWECSKEAYGAPRVTSSVPMAQGPGVQGVAQAGCQDHGRERLVRRVRQVGPDTGPASTSSIPTRFSSASLR